MFIHNNISPKQIINNNQNACYVFFKYGINSESDMPLNEICINNQINPDFIIDIIYQLDISLNNKNDCFYNYDLAILVDFLERSHSYYLNTSLPKIDASLLTLLNSDSNNHLLALANKLFNKFSLDIKEHFFFEEKNLFVFSKYLYNANRYDWSIQRINSFLVLYSLNDFVENHPKTEKDLDLLIKVLEEYKPKREAIMLYNILFNQINAFKKDLEIHALIEDKVLIDKLISLKSSLMHLSVN